MILVLNRPDSDPDQTANTALRNAVAGLPASGAAQLRALNAGTDLYLHDMERRLPQAEVHRFPNAAHFVMEDADAAEA